MNKHTITRRLAGAFLAGALFVGGLVVGGGGPQHHEPDQSDEVAGATWSRMAPSHSGSHTSTQGATWS